MYVDWEYYKIFYYVAKYQNFTKAARVTGPTTSQHHPLDEPAGKPAELRAVHPLQPGRHPDAGGRDALLPHRLAAVQIQDAEEELSASATLEHGSISISATETALNIYLAEKLRTFHTEYPGIRLRISNHSTPRRCRL